MASKSDNYPKHLVVNQADIKWEEYVLNRRGLACGEPNENAVAIVTTKCEKSADVIVPNVFLRMGKG